jgi:hypothetical protein
MALRDIANPSSIVCHPNYNACMPILKVPHPIFPPFLRGIFMYVFTMSQSKSKSRQIYSSSCFVSPILLQVESWECDLKVPNLPSLFDPVVFGPKAAILGQISL